MIETEEEKVLNLILACILKNIVSLSYPQVLASVESTTLKIFEKKNSRKFQRAKLEFAACQKLFIDT